MDKATAKSHLQRASTHEESAKLFSAALPYAGWKIVMQFYSALHFVEAYFATKTPTLTTNNHGARWRQILSLPELSTGRGGRFKPAYKRLEDLSKQVRYDPGFEVDQDDLEAAVADLNSVRGFLYSKVTSAIEETLQH